MSCCSLVLASSDSCTFFDNSSISARWLLTIARSSAFALFSAYSSAVAFCALDLGCTIWIPTLWRNWFFLAFLPSTSATTWVADFVCSPSVGAASWFSICVYHKSSKYGSWSVDITRKGISNSTMWKLSYNRALYSRCIAFLFLAAVTLLEQIKGIRLLIFVLISLKIAFIWSKITHLFICSRKIWRYIMYIWHL